MWRPREARIEEKSPGRRAHLAELSLRGLVKSYGGILAVDRVSLDAKDGELLVLVGPSGCGKSTILRLIAGLERPTEGQVVLGGRDLTHLEPRERNVAMVFQSYALYPHMTVRKNLSFGLRMRGVASQATEEKVRSVSGSLGILDLLDRYPSELSGGEKQRVALGRAIIREPSIFLLDEPLSNLDAKLRVSTRAEILRLHRRLGITTVYVTHDQMEAMTMGERLVVLDRGAVRQVGTPAEIYRRPVDAFVARFIGSPPMNILRGEVEAEGDAVTVALSRQRFTLRGDVRPPAHRGVLVGIRPESLQPRGEGKGRLWGRVEMVEMLGKEKIVHVRVEGEILLAITAPDLPAVEGARMDLGFEDRDVHLFDAGTERSLRGGSDAGNGAAGVMG